MKDFESTWLLPPDATTPIPNTEFARLWRAFMTARFSLAALLLVLEVALLFGQQNHNTWALPITLGYLLMVTLSSRTVRPRLLGKHFSWGWVQLVAVDALVFTALQWVHGSNLNFTPIYALPTLLVSVLGSRILAIGTVSCITLLLLLGNWPHIQQSPEKHATLVQISLSCLGYLFVGLLANYLTNRVLSAGQIAERNELQAELHRQVNALVIDSLPDGVLIINMQMQLMAINPAARRMLQVADMTSKQPIVPVIAPGQPLWELAHETLASQRPQSAELSLAERDGRQRSLSVRTQPTNPAQFHNESVCAIFLQDLREQEARIRTEKLASMGRMSAAVAHEIRNPLAAIVQANGLLSEDLTDPQHQHMTQLISQNAKRLEKIVDDVLSTSRIRTSGKPSGETMRLPETVHRICADWSQHHGEQQRLLFKYSNTDIVVQFDVEHLRRIMVNLLDNARRYASKAAASIQVHIQHHEGKVSLDVWSDGAPLDASLQAHLFEPFFSTESRSTGLGLFICQELCERNGAEIMFARTERMRGPDKTAGNSFRVVIPMVSVKRQNPQTKPRQATLLP
ncbi:PAS domain-containing protein [Curvibacter sp. CHRR-16]|uniref:two-component system sensor histidine kinase NtrB n=1 Tax=Curvibacter sp. CHRR-16 TaxID=2835872 RepID=UPI001BDB2525|nr:ATP-binding protein [Curvibacter sp. CHRR-16]MBT0570997.1 PAS domain-containing protein [Curvibacter sp. CHRR-16]